MYGFPESRGHRFCVVCNKWHDDWEDRVDVDSQRSMTCNLCKTVYYETEDLMYYRERTKSK